MTIPVRAAQKRAPPGCRMRLDEGEVSTEAEVRLIGQTLTYGLKPVSQSTPDVGVVAAELRAAYP